VLGASNYTFADVTRSQKLGDFVASNIRALEYFGGVPLVLVPDQLRSAVSGPDRYDPEINPTYAEFAQHYGIAVVPARPMKPKDKAKVEGAVLIAQRWILACLRNRTFFSLDELSEAVAELLERLNTRAFKKLDGCRRSAFEQLDRPVLRPLPPTRYEVGIWTKAKIDYCVELDGMIYSVPCTLVGARVELRSTAAVVEICSEMSVSRATDVVTGARGRQRSSKSIDPSHTGNTGLGRPRASSAGHPTWAPLSRNWSS